MTRESTTSDGPGGGALLASGVLFVALALLDFRSGQPPSNGAAILQWRDSQQLVLDFVSEVCFFATVLLVPGTIALYQFLAKADRTLAAAGCGLVAVVIAVMAVMLVIHGRLVYPIYGMRVDTPESAALVIMVFYGGVHAIYLLMAVATFVFSLVLHRSGAPTWITCFGFATAVLDVAGSYPWAIGPIPTLVCELSFGGWFVALGAHLYKTRGAAARPLA